ncbi:MAG TPA: LuxR C-terminal-related transcriptional regulator [Candidatus Nanopelagicales bacterium]
MTTPPLPRTTLVERLLRVPAAGLGLIVAPPGYGGSALLELVAAASPHPCLRIRLTPGLRPEVGFVEVLAEALVGVGMMAPPVADGDPRLPAAVLAALGAGPDLAILVDDLGLPGQDRIQAELDAFLQALPATVRVIVRARPAPRLDVSRFLAAGRLVLLDRGDLTLSEDEAREHLAQLAPGLDPHARDELVHLAEGWIGGLTAGVTGAGSRGGEDPGGWLLGPGLELLFHAPASGLPPEDDALLTLGSVMETLTPGACDHLTGRTDSAARLARLSELQIVHPTVSGIDGYRMHGLLREFYRTRLRRRGASAERDALLALAGWYEAAGDPDLAITCLLGAGAVDRAREVLASRLEEPFGPGTAETLRTWYRSAPQLALPPDALHLLAAAWADVLTGDVAHAGERLAQLRDECAREARTLPDDGLAREAAQGAVDWLSGEASLLDAYLALWVGRPRDALRLCTTLGPHLARHPRRTSNQLHTVLGIRAQLWSGDHLGVGHALSAAMRQPSTLLPYRRGMLPGLAAEVAVVEGRALRARSLAQQALEGIEQVGAIGMVDDCDARLALAGALRDLDDVAAAVVQAEHVAQQAGAVGHVTYEVLGRVRMALALAAAAEGKAAGDQLQRAAERARGAGCGRELALRVEAAAVEVAVLAGDRRAAQLALERIPAADRDPFLGIRVAGMGPMRPEAEVIRMVRADRPVTPRQVVDVRLLMALSLAGRPAEAAMHLRTAADLAVECGMLRALAGRGEEVLALAEQLAAEGTSPTVEVLLAHRATQPVPVTAPPTRPQLSGGEQDLLRRLAQSSGNRELADELGISVNTLKTRLRRLYAKLGVHDRASAIAAGIGR